jgi:hypothetical protein
MVKVTNIETRYECEICYTNFDTKEKAIKCETKKPYNGNIMWNSTYSSSWCIGDYVLCLISYEAYMRSYEKIPIYQIGVIKEENISGHQKFPIVKNLNNEIIEYQQLMVLNDKFMLEIVNWSEPLRTHLVSKSL